MDYDIGLGGFAADMPGDRVPLAGSQVGGGMLAAANPQTSGSDMFQIINQTAIDWYAILTNRGGPLPTGGGVNVRATAGGVTAQASTQTIVLFAAVILGAVFLLKK
ncbi:MAG: hypothetical protein A3E78_04290 [Alphaproteobacteria bacterium RIFCSPHIGHO2_12_FULL_63_12]|nr:MAG: hypothetical protein A3E78_04290 [Alphaproteobacteria bacterium RIFCSPHIGHO2_12_FULL_63_12]